MYRNPFFDVVVSDLDASPSLTALCAGYENGSWRYDKLVKRMFEEVPNFALSFQEREEFSDDLGVYLMSVAVRKIYATDKYQKRGEFGELLLHLVLREVFKTEPAVSKLFFKDAENDTVKGFDSVHVVASGDGDGDSLLELWLGEVKFYDNRAAAIRDVVAELAAHTSRDYLTAEFAMVASKLDRAWPHYERVRALLDTDRTSLDQVFDVLTIPVLLTYDSRAVAARAAEIASLPAHVSPSDTAQQYRADFAAEVRAGLAQFAAKSLPERVRVRLILVPLHKKEQLVTVLHARLQAWKSTLS